MTKIEKANNLLKEFEKRYGLNALNVDQGSEDWLNLKLGVISASNVSKAIAKKGSATRETYLASLVAQVCTGYMPDLNNKYVDWGKTNEDKARAFYEFQTGEKFTELPFVFKDDNFRFGASPDAIIGDKKGVEIKCPYSSENHIKTLMMDTIKPEYKWQIQYTMWVMGLEEYDFCSYDPRMKVSPLAIINVKKDEKAFERLDNELFAFVEEMDKMLKKIGIEWGQQWTMKKEK